MKKVCCMLMIFIIILTSFVFADETDTQKAIIINEIMAANEDYVMDAYGEFSDWVELYNPAANELDLSGYYLSDSKKNLTQYTFPQGTIIAPDSFFVVWCTGAQSVAESECYTNFKVSEGETVYLTAKDGVTVVDSLKAKNVYENESIGRASENSDEIVVFLAPTPRRTNVGAKVRIDEPIFSHKAGFYEEGFDLTLTCENGGTIYYTLDGSEPDQSDIIYTGPVHIDSKSGEPNTISEIPTNSLDTNRAWKKPQGEVFKSTVIRACVYKNGEKSRIATATYFVDKDIYNRYGVSVASIVTDADNLFDFFKGIYVAGEDLNYQKEGREWEREASFEFFDKDGKLKLNQDVGIRIHGAFSTAFPQKSLRVYARSEYGKNELDYRFFEDNDVKKFKSIIIRNSGNDFGNLMFLDAMYQSLWKENKNAIIQDSKPAVLFINGEYWGISNIREHYSENYFEKHFGGEKENYIIAENGGLVIDTGTKEDRNSFIDISNFAASNDMNIKENYDKVEKWVDLDNMATYFVAQIFAGNNDWPGNNLGVFRYRVNPNSDGLNPLDGRWRFYIKDVDQAYGYKTVNTNVIPEIIKQKNGNYPVKLFTSMLKSEKFRNKFLVTFCDAINTNLSRENISKVASKNKEIYRELIDEHIARWGTPDGFETWERLVDCYKTFGNRRAHVVTKQLKELVSDFGELNSVLMINVNNPEYGEVLLNGVPLNKYDSTSVSIDGSLLPVWSGKYFDGANVELTAVAKEGYKFVGWEMTYASPFEKINVTLHEGNNMFVAKFVPIN